jgi:hypothetical protein
MSAVRHCGEWHWHDGRKRANVTDAERVMVGPVMVQVGAHAHDRAETAKLMLIVRRLQSRNGRVIASDGREEISSGSSHVHDGRSVRCATALHNSDGGQLQDYRIVKSSLAVWEASASRIG